MVNLSIRHWAKTSIGIVICRGRIGKEHHSVVAEHCITRRRMTAVLCRCSRDDNRIDAPLTQYDIQVRSEKTAVAMFLDYVLTGCRGEIVFRPLHYADVEIRIPNVEKARELLGFEAEVELDEGLERTIAWYLSRALASA